MINTRLIKRRIKSAKNIAQITKAMQMVAASKMKKAQERALSGKPYAEKIYTAVQEFYSCAKDREHPLLRVGNPAGKVLVILLSTNKGLCGGLNTNLFRKVTEWWEKENVDYVTVGKKGQYFLTRTGKNLVADFSVRIPFTENVPPLTELVVENFVNGVYREVYLAYNTFISVLKQIPTKKQILPITELTTNQSIEKLKFGEFLVEPNTFEMLEYLLPHYLENQIRSAILEQEACEHSSRMMAMKKATESALDFMESLTLLFNKVRQEKITYEISDMVTARIAVES